MTNEEDYADLIDPSKGFVLITVEDDRHLAMATNFVDDDAIVIVLLEEALNTLKANQETAAWETNDVLKKVSKGLH